MSGGKTQITGEIMTPEERNVLRQCVEYLLKPPRFFKEEPQLFETSIGVDRDTLMAVYMNWYAPEPLLSDRESDDRHVVTAVSGLLRFTKPGLSDEEWSANVEATPEEALYILLKLKRQLRRAEESRKTWLQLTVRYFLANPTLVITAGYLYLTVFGLTYKWSLYRAFELNLFEFASASDFLLAGFEQPIGLLNAVIGLGAGLCIVFGSLREHLRAVGPLLRVVQASVIFLGFAGWLIGPPYTLGQLLASEIREGSTRLALIETNVDNRCVRASSQVGVIGVAGGFTFVHNPTPPCTAAIAMTEISSIEFTGEPTSIGSN